MRGLSSARVAGSHEQFIPDKPDEKADMARKVRGEIQRPTEGVAIFEGGHLTCLPAISEG